MNSSVNPSSESSNPASDSVQTGKQSFSNRQQPIPPPSDPMQYRAIGLVRGSYKTSLEQFTQGTLVATDGTKLNAVLLGRIMSLVKNHLDLEQEHLWVVYPHMGQQDGNLHLQIVGVWEPDKLVRQTSINNEEVADVTTLHSLTSHSLSEVEDGYFSVRGEVIYQSTSDSHFIVKIKQAPRKESDKPKYFKLKLQGVLETKAVGQFWDLHVTRQADSLVLNEGKAITLLPSKPKLKKNKPRQEGYSDHSRQTNTPRPVRKIGDSTSAMTRPIPKSPSPKPIKRQKPQQG